MMRAALEEGYDVLLDNLRDIYRWMRAHGATDEDLNNLVMQAVSNLSKYHTTALQNIRKQLHPDDTPF